MLSLNLEILFLPLARAVPFYPTLSGVIYTQKMGFGCLLTRFSLSRNCVTLFPKKTFPYIIVRTLCLDGCCCWCCSKIIVWCRPPKPGSSRHRISSCGPSTQQVRGSSSFSSSSLHQTTFSTTAGPRFPPVLLLQLSMTFAEHPRNGALKLAAAWSWIW